MVNTDLREAHSYENLKKAWRWLNSNSDVQYKSYFRHIYKAYSCSVEANIENLHKRLKKEDYEATHATKIYLPKASGLQRVYTLLTVEDQIVYQAFANVIAERLLPRVRRRYHKEIFGHLYAGSRNAFFYQDWRKSYKKFSKEIRNVFNKGYAYTATFDLTACYDTIDHSVLEYFLEDLGLSKEFNKQLCSYLKIWTAAKGEKRIYQGHGIPQGPLSSGLISEVVLRYFDEKKKEKPKAWKYFRYVDDIRVFAKNEQDLRSLLVDMDLVSKQIGLFPQSSKISIRKVHEIEDEIKSISNPPELVVRKANLNQEKIRGRLRELSIRHKINNETRFKYVLGSAEPNSELAKRLIRILDLYPHLYVSIFNYLNKFEKLPSVISKGLLTHIKANHVYASFAAHGLKVLNGKCHASSESSLMQFAKSLTYGKSATDNSELRTIALTVLLKYNQLSYSQTLKEINENDEWWPRSELLVYINQEHIGRPSYETVLNEALKDGQPDPSVVAADLLIANSLSINTTVDEINPVAQLALKEAGIIGKRRNNSCLISNTMKHILGERVSDINWKDMLGRYYKNVESKALRLKGYSDTDATAYVNLLDTIHDNLARSLFEHDSSIGTYSNFGSILNAAGRFASKYPDAYKSFKLVHEKRLESALSHPKVKRTNRNTKFIKFKFISDSKTRLIKGYLDIWSKW